MTDRLSQLLRDLGRSAGFAEGSPHWRAQNQLAHAGIGMLTMLICQDFGLSRMSALAGTLVIWSAWEAAILILFAWKGFAKTSHFAKSAADIVFYMCGALTIASTQLVERVATTIMLFLLLVVWSCLRADNRESQHDSESTVQQS